MSVTQRRVLFLTSDEETFLLADADAVIARLRSQTPAEWTDFAFIRDADDEDSGWISVFRAGDRGWLVSCHGNSDRHEYFLKHPSSDDRTPVTVTIADAPETFGARAFVSEDDAMRAVRGYVTNLERAPGEWVSISELAR